MTDALAPASSPARAGPAASPRRPAIRPTRSIPRRRYLRRALTLALATLRIAALGALSRLRGGGRLAHQLRRARILRRELERLGGVFVKIGQLLSIRTDQLPWEVCREFTNLLDRVVPFPGELAEQILERELAAPLAAHFDAFERQPIAAASIGQVHVARLRRDGSKVAIKIQRPQIREQVAIDLDLAAAFARLIDLVNIFSGQRLTPMVDELRRMMDEELSYRNEARAAYDFRRTLKGRRHLRAPKIHHDLTTDAVLTMEFIDGLPASALVKAIEGGDVEALELFEELGIDRDKLAQRFFRAILEQIYEFNVCHIDPHAGNLILLPGNRIGFIDFGSVGYFGPTLREGMERIAAAMARGDVDAAVDATLASWEPLPLRDVHGFKAELKPLLQRMIINGASKYGDPNYKSNGRMLVDSTALAAKYGIQPPWDHLRFTRLLWGYDTLVTSICPEFNFARGFRGYTRHRARRRLAAHLSSEGLGRFALGMVDVLADLPGDLKELRHQALHAIRRSDHLYVHSMSKVSYIGKVALDYGLVALIAALGWLIYQLSAVGLAAADAALADLLPLPLPWWICAALLVHLIARVQQIRLRFSDID